MSPRQNIILSVELATLAGIALLFVGIYWKTTKVGKDSNCTPTTAFPPGTSCRVQRSIDSLPGRLIALAALVTCRRLHSTCT